MKLIVTVKKSYIKPREKPKRKKVKKPYINHRKKPKRKKSYIKPRKKPKRKKSQKVIYKTEKKTKTRNLPPSVKVHQYILFTGIFPLTIIQLYRYASGMEKKELLEASLEDKLKQTKRLIMEWYEQFDGKVYVAFSGGKDSTVLLHIVRSLYPDVVGVFANTGLEYPEIVEFVKTVDNIEVLRPKRTFKEVIETEGYPVISKEQSQYIKEYRNTNSEKLRKTRIEGNKWGMGKVSKKWQKFMLNNEDIRVTDVCCNVFKKEPFKRYEKYSGNKGFIGTMAGESHHRRTLYLKDDCNGFKKKRPISKPLSFWSESDVYKYIRDFNVKISPIYEMGYTRTGCMFCMYGLHIEQKLGEDRFQRMKRTHPKLYEYCMRKLGLGKVIRAYTGVDYDAEDL